MEEASAPPPSTPAAPASRTKASFASSLASMPFLLRVLICAAIVLFLKQLGILKTPDASPNELMGVPRLYQAVVSQMAKRPIAPHTAVLEIDAERLPGIYAGSNVCSQRLFIAELIHAMTLSSDQPYAIAIDKYFGEKTCSVSAESEAHSKALQEAIKAASEKKLGVIVGARLLENDENLENDDHKALKLKHPTARPLVPTLLLAPAQVGVINVADNVRQAPLRFAGVLPGSAKVGLFDSLAWLAVHLKDPSGMQRMEDRFKPTDETAPYISFLDQKILESHTFSAGAALCHLDPVRAAALKLDCGTKGTTFASEQLRGRIVIIGEKTEADIHDAPTGKIYGYFLHANYIEALLDGRYFYPAPWIVNVLCAVLLVLALEYTFYRYEEKRPMAVFGGVLAACAIFLLLEFMIAQILHWLLLPYVTLAGLAAQGLERLVERVVKYLSQARPVSANT